jgi:hypothetical protein
MQDEKTKEPKQNETTENKEEQSAGEHVCGPNGCTLSWVKQGKDKVKRK